jgi:hypothetical protein
MDHQIATLDQQISTNGSPSRRFFICRREVICVPSTDTDLVEAFLSQVPDFHAINMQRIRSTSRCELSFRYLQTLTSLKTRLIVRYF